MNLRIALLLLFLFPTAGWAQLSQEQLAKWLKRFPDADTDKDGRLSVAEANAYRGKLRQKQNKKQSKRKRGVKQAFRVDPGWSAERFPKKSVCYLNPREIASVYEKLSGRRGRVVTSYERPADGSLRIVATGHSFMAPAFKTFPLITQAAGLKQPPLVTHTGGGMTGSARYKWEQENGIFQFDGQPRPKLLSSIANAQWDAMLWGPYYQDRPEYYSCWIDFCLKYNPKMKFYLSDAWPQLADLPKVPQSEKELTDEVFARIGKTRHAGYVKLIGELNEKYDDRVHVLPTSEAMILAVQHYHRGELPGVEGIHTLVGKKRNSLWRDRIGHLGPGFGNLEGYVFYATIYGRSPELIQGDVRFAGKASAKFPSRELDRVFRKIAWQAVLNNPLSGVVDKNNNGVDDARE